MKINRRHREGAEVSTDSLSDIMFFLLIFFLILSTLVNPSVIKINLPSSKANQQIDTKPIALVVTKDLQYLSTTNSLMQWIWNTSWLLP